jgi:hypothetical protein
MMTIGGLVVKVWDQGVCSSIVSGSSLVVANMIAIEGLHGR